MSFGGLILTNQGRNKIAAAIGSEKALQFTHVQFGDGVFNGSYPSKKELTNMVMEIPVTRVARRDNEVTIDCDWNSSQAPQGFYFREIGIIGNGALCYYDNAGTGDAEYIDPDSELVSKEKRIRLTVVVNDDVNITVHTASNLYALSTEVEQKLSELDKKKVNESDIHDWARNPEKPVYSKEEIGLGNVDNTADKDKPLSTAMQEAIGQKANQSELDTHVNNDAIHFTASERTKLAGIATGANKYTHPASATGVKSSGLYKIATDANGHVTGVTAVTKADITALGIPASDTNTTYGTGTASVSGLTKLYTSTGTSTDGTMTRAAITDTLKWKSIGGSQGLISISLSSITSSYNDIIVEVLCGESESRYVYTWNIARSSLPASSQKGKRLISGYSTGGYSGYCEVLISTSYTQIVKAIVGNREYVGDGAILTIYYR